MSALVLSSREVKALLFRTVSARQSSPLSAASAAV